jgi:hypothetical protein
MKSLLYAADLDSATIVGLPEKLPLRIDEDFQDGVFNMRDNVTGLNLDFMSYAAYAQVGFDPTALLDADVLAKTSQKIFSIFFQHFVTSNMSRESGSYVYQPRGVELKVNPPMSSNPIQHTPDGSLAPKFEDVVRNTNETTTATIHTQVEVLQMNFVAFWIATSILIWLIITIIILASVQRKYYGGMMRNIECIADVLVLIAGSERLLEVIREKGFDAIVKEDKLLTRMGWFRDPDGTMRWRIDVVEEKQVQMEPIRLGPGYTPVPNGNDEGDGDAVSIASGPRLSVDAVSHFSVSMRSSTDPPNGGGDAVQQTPQPARLGAGYTPVPNGNEEGDGDTVSNRSVCMPSSTDCLHGRGDAVQQASRPATT